VDAWEVVSAVSGAVAAVAAAWAAWQSRGAAREANLAATTLARIEEERRLAELTPVLELALARETGTVSPRLTVRLAGPPGLDRVDSLTVAIRDDSDRRARNALPGGPSAEEIRRHVWAPLRFVPDSGPDDARADESGRAVTYAHPLASGDSLIYLLEPTSQPRWGTWNGNGWLAAVGTVLRLSFTMTRSGRGDWTLPCDLEMGPVLMQPGAVKAVLPIRP
jgi:hypothetical protein